MPDLLIPATVIGSWSFPGWYEKFVADVGRGPEQFGPIDREEAVRDAVRLAIDDQLRAGLDRITDGEMQRVDFNLGFYDYLEGHRAAADPSEAGGARPRPAEQVSLRRPAARAPTASGWSRSIAACASLDRRARSRCRCPGRSRWPAASRAARSTATATPSPRP